MRAVFVFCHHHHHHHHLVVVIRASRNTNSEQRNFIRTGTHPLRRSKGNFLNNDLDMGLEEWEEVGQVAKLLGGDGRSGKRKGGGGQGRCGRRDAHMCLEVSKY